MNGYEYKRCSFLVEWDDEDASLVRKFQLLYYLEDDTIELYELRKNKGARPRLFLKRTRVAAVNLGTMHVGSTFNVMGRNMRISDFADEFTRNKLGKLLQVVDHSERARVEAPGSLRALFGRDKGYNAVHGSNTEEDSKRELDIFFPSTQVGNLSPPRTSATLQGTLCIVKPHALKEGHLGSILQKIRKGGFRVMAMQMFYVERVNAEELYEVYKGVVPEYADMVDELTQGACVALEVRYDADVGESHSRFRELAGPRDPDIARHIEPSTLRAKFGKTRVENAVHCTDLPEDVVSEVEYFFLMLQ
uniref:DM10 domain-containing protein n=1 Tax=Timema cristinae TaxID=61476 RepID=A0A7R9CCD8_TIMCR|nr:unnamed protein product [Timema cristinae]